MSLGGRRKIVLLGMMTKIPVAGVVWQTLHYLLGFQRLGFDVYYVEAHARTPSMLMTSDEDDSGALAAAFVDRIMRRFDFGDRWCFHALHADGRLYGMSERELRRVYAEAELIVNLHGGTQPRAEHYETGRLVYVETDPVLLQLELAEDVAETIEFLEPHVAFFTFGENWGNPSCGLPIDDRFAFHATRQPVILDLWDGDYGSGEAYTTVGNWHQPWRDVVLDGEVYGWSKRDEFLKFADLPRLAEVQLEAALSGCRADDLDLLLGRGWRIRDGLEVSDDIDVYRRYIAGSRGEFTAAKDQNVRLRTGWFSDRSATYLAAGRPVVTQDTGFGEVLPAGEGLFAVASVEEAAEALRTIEGEYTRHRRAASAIAQSYFDADVVLRRLLADVGVELPGHRGRRFAALPPELDLEPRSRRPLALSEATLRWAGRLALPAPHPPRDEPPQASVVLVTYEGVALTSLCFASLLASTNAPSHEIIAVDNGSADGTLDFLRRVARLHSHVRVIANQGNLGFPAAVNQGLAEARGDMLVILNNDTILPEGWLARLACHLDDPRVGLVGATTNRIGTAAEIECSYGTYAEFVRLASTRAEQKSGQSRAIDMAAMFCLAFRRDTYEQLGPLDERFEVGLLEDDDYSRRAREAGYRVVCADDVVVHHFGEGSFGRLFADGEFSRLLDENRRRFEDKWGVTWSPYERSHSAEYEAIKARIRELVLSVTASGEAVIVASKGDDELLQLDGREGWHFPQDRGGVYAGRHPASCEDAIAQVERLRAQGGRYFVIPSTIGWWLDHYTGFLEHLDRYTRVVEDDACLIFDLGRTSP